mmetsp:Transcript_10998/g.23057  ORF Transcript_10998/g.23057 Transcript_10998/m.23057 type:complete len:252 (-) Transcript_10998:754-1509(-)
MRSRPRVSGTPRCSREVLPPDSLHCPVVIVVIAVAVVVPALGHQGRSQRPLFARVHDCRRGSAVVAAAAAAAHQSRGVLLRTCYPRSGAWRRLERQSAPTVPVGLQIGSSSDEYRRCRRRGGGGSSSGFSGRTARPAGRCPGPGPGLAPAPASVGTATATVTRVARTSSHCPTATSGAIGPFAASLLIRGGTAATAVCWSGRPGASWRQGKKAAECRQRWASASASASSASGPGPSEEDSSSEAAAAEEEA